jgi:hypothetical protein
MSLSIDTNNYFLEVRPSTAGDLPTGIRPYMTNLSPNGERITFSQYGGGGVLPSPSVYTPNGIPSDGIVIAICTQHGVDVYNRHILHEELSVILPNIVKALRENVAADGVGIPPSSFGNITSVAFDDGVKVVFRYCEYYDPELYGIDDNRYDPISVKITSVSVPVTLLHAQLLYADTV